MPTVSARPALIDDLPAIVDLLADDVLGQDRANIGSPLHSDYFDAFEAIDDVGAVLLILVLDGLEAFRHLLKHRFAAMRQHGAERTSKLVLQGIDGFRGQHQALG